MMDPVEVRLSRDRPIPTMVLYNETVDKTITIVLVFIGVYRESGLG